MMKIIAGPHIQITGIRYKCGHIRPGCFKINRLDAPGDHIDALILKKRGFIGVNTALPEPGLKMRE